MLGKTLKKSVTHGANGTQKYVIKEGTNKVSVMFGQHFYHKQIRNTVIAFGTIFNNINIKRTDSSGNPLQTIRVPLSYAPKEKFIARLDQNVDLTGNDSSVAITLPRMSFDITGYSYDATRKLNKTSKDISYKKHKWR